MNKKKILIIEDEKSIASALDTKLQSEGFETTVAFNGEEGIDFLKKEKYDLILLDLLMPKVDGFETLEEIREENIDAPVIVISNLSQYLDVKRAFQLGAKDFLVKSNTPLASVVDRVREVLNK